MNARPHILLVQFRTDESSLEKERRAIERAIDGQIMITSRYIFDFTSPNELREVALAASGVIFGGSGDFDLDGGRDETDPAKISSQKILLAVKPALEAIIANGRAFFGICYGYQLLAELCGGRVRNNKDQSKFGTHAVTLTDEGRCDPLFGEFPTEFAAQYGHKDSVSQIPEKATLLAHGTSCKSSALRYGKRAYTTQFHPELTEEDIRARVSSWEGYLPVDSTVDDVARPSPEANSIIARWCELIVNDGSQGGK